MPDNSKHDSRSGRLRSILSGRPSTSFSNPDTAGQEFDSITHDVTPAVTRESFQRVRFSIEVDSVGITPQAARRGTTLLSENALRSALGPGLEAIHSNEPEEPVATPMPRKRNRGYSLRRQLFSRNAEQDQYSDGRLDPGEGAAKIDLPDSMEMGMLAMSPTPPEFTKPLPDELAGIGAQESRPRFMSSSMDARLQRAAVGWSDLKKTVMRTHELPPTKEGRKIPLDAERVDLLMDERTGYQYVNNTIRSSRYTVWNFLPKQLFYQFSKLANFYFLCVSILQMIPTLSTTGTYTTIVPLLFFITISISKEGYDDYRRYKLDKGENNRDADIFHQPTEDAESNGPHWAPTKWKDIRVGDIVRLERDDWVPADLVVLHTEGENGIAFIETMALDGETNLKSKQALPIISEQCDTPEKLGRFRAEMVVEDPNLDLYNFEGKVNVGDETKPLTNNQVVYRGSILRNTPAMTGMVIFTGEESKIRMNANKNPRTKAPALQAIVNRVVFTVVILVIALAVFNTVSYLYWQRDVEIGSWYLDDSSVAFFPIFASYIIMFNTLIPLSLYVSLEIIKVAQMVLLNDIDMYHEESDTPFEARTSTINEDCGQVSYIFSDKTGTLTDNVMLFRKLSVGGQAWLHDFDIQQEEDEEAGTVMLRHKRRKGKAKCKPNKPSKRPSTAQRRYGDPNEKPRDTRKSMGDIASVRPQKPHKMSLDGIQLSRSESTRSRWTSSANPEMPQPQLSTRDLLEYLRMRPHTFFARKTRFFLLSIAICHTCLPEVDEEDGSIDYQAASPDELALVRAAQDMGYIAINRQINTITIKTFPSGPDTEPLIEVYQILEVIEFSSKRKRMSIIVRLPNGNICIFCKGADSTMIELLRLRELARNKALEVERRATARKSMEAQEVMRRTSMQRNSISLSRPSISLSRPSIGGTTRPSMKRLHSIKDEFDDWLRDKDATLNRGLRDDSESYYSRPSGQFGARHSLAYGDVPNEPLDNDFDEDIVDEELALDDAKVFERCFAHVNLFATEGLRTLLYAHRFIEDHEYDTWKRIYAEATTSLVGRKAMIERAAEIIERDFELTGATAIEDKLQKGVPESVDKLRRAGIKLWMLTGDKRETAINIGHSCRLIKDYSTVTILQQDDVSIANTIRSAIYDIKTESVAHSVVVVDGGTLSMIESDPELNALFFDIAVLTDSVICCRASPSQKASLVKTIRTKVQKSVTLAIGDGANDIAMIQEAHIGVGISGREGLQAARCSDYSMAQFRFLLKFLLVHGRWNYSRVTKYTVTTFWKELLFYLTQAMFQRWNGYTGSSLYESWSLSMFNTLFTSLPVIFLGIFEKDLQASTLLAVPELYNFGQKNRGFNYRIYFGWMLLATSQAMLTYFVMFQIYAKRLMVDQSVYALGVLTYTTVIILISTKIQIIEMHNKSYMAALSFVLSVGGWFTWNLILSAIYTKNIIFNVKGSFIHHFGQDLAWWLSLLIALSICLLLDILFIATRVMFYPTDVDEFQAIEQNHELRQSLEEAASEELQQGWRGREEKAREDEVQAILDRPREMEEGRGSGMSSTFCGEDEDEMVMGRFGGKR